MQSGGDLTQPRGKKQILFAAYRHWSAEFIPRVPEIERDTWNEFRAPHNSGAEATALQTLRA
ncbi:MAG TPA: hypothetical protein VIV82_08435, partial [Verrucomicrobiae bacterium]